jgi:hypothetical protein
MQTENGCHFKFAICFTEEGSGATSNLATELTFVRYAVMGV